MQKISTKLLMRAFKIQNTKFKIINNQQFEQYKKISGADDMVWGKLDLCQIP